jgi:hypothetical protein
MGEDAGIDINALFWSYADEEVGMLYASLFEGMYAGGGSLIGHHVVFAECAETLIICIN